MEYKNETFTTGNMNDSNENIEIEKISFANMKVLCIRNIYFSLPMNCSFISNVQVCKTKHK